MIFDDSNFRRAGTAELSVFGAEFDVDPSGFTTNLPNLNFYEWVAQVDPALGRAFPDNAFPTAVGSGDLGNFGFTAYAQFCSTVRAARMALGQMASTVGFLRSALPSLTEVFRGPVSAVGDALNVAAQVLDNPGFNAAINSLTAIPIVGWIIKAAVAIAKLVVKIVDAVRKNRSKRQEAWRQMRSLMPLAQWDPEIDAIQVRTLGVRLHTFDTAYAFLPRYAAKSPEDFYAVMASGEPNSKRVDAWRLLTRYADSGLGFVPGTQNLHGAIEMPIGFCGGVKDLGDFFPTARQTAFQLWQTVLAADTPALFSVPTRKVSQAWESYVISAVEYTLREVSGWSCAADPQNGGSVVPRRAYLSESGGYPTKQVDPSDRTHPKTVAIKGLGHRSALNMHLHTLFDWDAGVNRQLSVDSSAFYDSFDFDKTIPGRALANLRERQLAALEGVLAAYVDDSRVRPGAGAIEQVPRWPAIADKSEGLWTVWDRARRELLQGDGWKSIELDDVPGGPSDPYRDKLSPDDRSFHAALVAKGLRPGGTTRPTRVGRRPPPPPPVTGYLTIEDRHPGRIAGAIAGTLAAAGAGYWLYNRRRANA